MTMVSISLNGLFLKKPTLLCTDMHPKVHYISAFFYLTDTCRCDFQWCVMARTINLKDPPQTWSSCSVAAFSRVSDNLARCLHNIPHPDDILGAPVCGDGIVQGDEVCDCGSPQVCVSESQKTVCRHVH